MLSHRCQRDPKRPGQLRHRYWTPSQPVQHRPTCSVTECMKNPINIYSIFSDHFSFFSQAKNHGPVGLPSNAARSRQQIMRYRHPGHPLLTRVDNSH